MTTKLSWQINETTNSRYFSYFSPLTICMKMQSLFSGKNKIITKSYLYNFNPLYIAKLGITGVYIIFIISAQKKKDCGTR